MDDVKTLTQIPGQKLEPANLEAANLEAANLGPTKRRIVERLKR
ncbi:MAG: hypothetical protein QOC79_286, partial [Actinomycetota bacterium]|nr:hypothetical protein [Actinomycetota bacterium]